MTLDYARYQVHFGRKLDHLFGISELHPYSIRELYQADVGYTVVFALQLPKCTMMHSFRPQHRIK